MMEQSDLDALSHLLEAHGLPAEFSAGSAKHKRRALIIISILICGTVVHFTLYRYEFLAQGLELSVSYIIDSLYEWARKL